MTGPHPPWCDRRRCTANGVRSGAHRSALATVADTGIQAGLYALAGAPDDVFVEVCCPKPLLSPREAYHFGKVLTSLGKVELSDVEIAGRPQ